MLSDGVENSRGRRTRKHRRRLPRRSRSSEVPVYVALRAALTEWRTLGAYNWVLDTIESGIKIDWVSPPARFRSKEYPFHADDAAFLKEELQRGLRQGFIQEVTGPADLDDLVCISSAFVVHTAVKSRVVLD